MVSVFLSYPSEVSEQGERLSSRLKAAGYNVFFAPRDLKASHGFDACLYKNVKSADFFVFIITRKAITRGRYTLTELALAERHFGRRIAQRLLPVMFEDGIPEQDLPPSLSAVHILRPQGDVIAETIIALEVLSGPIRRGRNLRSLGVMLLFIALLAGTGYFIFRYLQPPGLVYDGPQSLYASSLKDAGLQDDPVQINKLALPEHFLGKRISLLAFSSFEGTERDQDFWCVVTACKLTEFALGLRDHPSVSPVESNKLTHSGAKSLNFAPALIEEVADRTQTISATRHKKVFDVAGAERVWLNFWQWSDTNPRPRDVHNCDSSLNLYYRLDGSDWTHLTALCGACTGESLSNDMFPQSLNVLLNGAKTFEFSMALEIQNVNTPLQDRVFLIDDFAVIAEWPNL